jgi:hypothetical protein
MRTSRFQTSPFQNRSRAINAVAIMVGRDFRLLLAMAIPNFLKSRTNAQKQICIENLSQIELDCDASAATPLKCGVNESPGVLVRK